MDGSSPLVKSRFKNFLSDTAIDLSVPEEEKRKRLAQSLFRQGEKRLLEGDGGAISLLDLSLQLDPNNPILYYKQGLSLLEYATEKNDEKALLLSSKRLKIATRLKPSFFEAWQAWGTTLYTLGKVTGEHHFFLEAEKTLKRAILTSAQQPVDLVAELYWSYGLVWSEIGIQSDEASDFHLAVEAFEKAKEQLESLPAEFWIDHGRVAIALGSRINDRGMTYKAIDLFKHAVSIAIGSFDGWFELAGAFKSLYELTHDDDHFVQSSQCYSSAAKINGNVTAVWLKWADLLIESGRITKDPKKIRSSIEKCHRAYSCDQENSAIVAIWVEALALLGSITERIDLIYEAQRKLTDTLNDGKETPSLYYAYGICLLGLGKYFNDLDYYYQAIEKFQEGLSIDRTEYRLWHALGATYSVAASIELDPKLHELSQRFYKKALSFRTTPDFLFDYALSLSKYGELVDSTSHIEQAVTYFEEAIGSQKNAVYLHPEWFFEYAVALDLYGEHADEESYHLKAIEILNHVLIVDPEFPEIHHRLGLIYTHYGELSSNPDAFERALRHFRLATGRDEENDQVILDWGIALVNYAECLEDMTDPQPYYQEAEQRMTKAAQLGNPHAYYHLACLYSMTGSYDEALRFLKKAHDFEALPPLSELLEDDWLEGVRNTELFHEFISRIEAKNSSP